jgi:hypothetical protein
MPDITTFFRHCPSCGRRFEIRLVSKEPFRSESFSEKDEHAKGSLSRRDVAALAGSLSSPGGISGSSSRPYGQGTIVQEDKPSIIDVEEFQYDYKCKHCGHQWSEVHETDRRMKEPKGYGGD